MPNSHFFTPLLAGSLLLVTLLITGCRGPHETPDALPFYRSAQMTPEWIAASADDYATIHRVGDFSFVNQDGTPITAQDFDGKIYVANFFFVQCGGICPTMRTNLSAVQAAYQHDDEVLLLSHSVMPETDTVAKLHNYATVNKVISGKWHLVTGKRETVYALARNAYFANLAEDNFLHTENFFLVDKDRRIRGIYNGTLSLDVQRLIEDIATLKQEYAG